MVCACKRCRTIVGGKTAKAAVAHHFNHLIDSRQLFQIDGLSLVRFVRSFVRFVYSIFRSDDVVHCFFCSFSPLRTRCLYKTLGRNGRNVLVTRLRIENVYAFFSTSALTLQWLWFSLGCTLIWSPFGCVQCAGARRRRRIETKKKHIRCRHASAAINHIVLIITISFGRRDVVSAQ